MMRYVAETEIEEPSGLFWQRSEPLEGKRMEGQGNFYTSDYQVGGKLRRGEERKKER
jgi:hypothetical protein